MPALCVRAVASADAEHIPSGLCRAPAPGGAAPRDPVHATGRHGPAPPGPHDAPAPSVDRLDLDVARLGAANRVPVGRLALAVVEDLVGLGVLGGQLERPGP